MVNQIESAVISGVACKPPIIASNAVMLEQIIKALCLKDAKEQKQTAKKKFLQKIASISNSILDQIATYRAHGYISDTDLPAYYKMLKDNEIDSFKLELQVASEYTNHKNRETPNSRSVVFDSVQMLLAPLNEIKEDFKAFELTPLVIVEPPSSSVFLAKAYEVCTTVRRECSVLEKWHQRVDEGYIVKQIEAHAVGIHFAYVVSEVLSAIQQTKSCEWRLDAIDEK